MASRPVSVDHHSYDDTILFILSKAKRLTNVQDLQNAAAQALEINETISKIKNYKEAFKKLSNDACSLVCMVLCDVEEFSGSVPASYQAEIKDMSTTLQKIHHFSTEQVSMNTLWRLVSNVSAGIQMYHKRLEIYPNALNLRFRPKTRIDVLISLYHDQVQAIDRILQREREAGDSHRDRMPKSPGAGQSQTREASSQRFQEPIEREVLRGQDTRRTQGERRDNDDRRPSDRPCYEQQSPYQAMHQNQPSSMFNNNPASIPGLFHHHIPPAQNLGVYPYPWGYTPDGPTTPFTFAYPAWLPPMGIPDTHSPHGSQSTYIDSPVSVNSGNTTTTTVTGSFNRR